MVYSIILIFVIAFCIRKERVLNFSNFFLASILYLICFAIFPLLFVYVDLPYNYTKGWVRFINIDPEHDRHIINLSCLLGLLGYLLFTLGYKVFKFKSKELISFKPKQKTLILYFSTFIFFVGMLSFIVYLNSLGSIVSGFFMNNRMLHEDDRVDVDSSVSFLFVFSKIIIASSYVQWANMKINKSRAVTVIFWISLLVSFLYLFRSSGRLSVITFIFTFGLAEAIYNRRVPTLKLVILVLIAGFFTLFGKSIFSMFLYEDALDRTYSRYTEGDEFLFPLLDFFGEFSFPFLSLTTNLNMDIDWLWFKDLIFWFTYALPAGLFPTVLNTSYFNTVNVLGPSIDKAGVPSDILSYGYLNLGFLGIIFVTFCFGIVCRWLDSFQRVNTNPLSSIMTIGLTFIMAFRIMYFDPKHLFKGSFYFYFVLLLILAVIYFNRRYKVRI